MSQQTPGRLLLMQVRASQTAALGSPALGRKNYLFVCNDEAGENLAGLMSILAICEANGVNPEPPLHAHPHLPPPSTAVCSSSTYACRKDTTVLPQAESTAIASPRPSPS
jgi:hypothetical protein